MSLERPVYHRGHRKELLAIVAHSFVHPAGHQLQSISHLLLCALCG